MGLRAKEVLGDCSVAMTRSHIQLHFCQDGQRARTYAHNRRASNGLRAARCAQHSFDSISSMLATRVCMSLPRVWRNQEQLHLLNYFPRVFLEGGSLSSHHRFYSPHPGHLRGQEKALTQLRGFDCRHTGSEETADACRAGTLELHWPDASLSVWHAGSSAASPQSSRKPLVYKDREVSRTS